MSDARKEKETVVEVTSKASILMPVGLRDQLFKLLASASSKCQNYVHPP